MNVSVDYYKIVIGVAVFVFIITMIVFWYFIRPKPNEYPPVMTNCPLNWKVNQDGTCTIPINGINTGNLKKSGKMMYKKISNNGSVTYITDPMSGSIKYTDEYGNPYLAYTGENSGVKFPDFPAGYDDRRPEINVVDFRDEKWGKTTSVLCANHDWAVKNNIYWEGVSNYNHCK
jgi:hypothetical protein